MLALGIAAILFQHTVTANIGPATADHALAELSLASGQKLVCSPELKREVLMIRVHGADWETLKGKVANVAGGQWRLRRDEWVLERPAALVRTLRGEVLEKRVQQIGGEIAKKAPVEPWGKPYLNSLLVQLSTLAEKEHSASPRDHSTAVNALYDAGRGGPAGRALHRILALMDPRLIASLDTNSMAVFSGHPTSMEQPLPAKIDKIFRDFLDEQRDYAQEIERRSDLFAPVAYLDPRFNISSANTPARKFFVTIRRFQEGAIEAALVAADSDGWHVASAHEFLDWSDKPGGDFSTLPKAPLALSQDAKDFESIYAVVSGRYGGDLGDKDRARRLAREWMPKFAQSAKIEPMSFVVGDGLSKISDSAGANLVANLPDSVLTLVPGFYDSNLWNFDFLKRLTVEGSNCVGSFQGGWLEIEPKDRVKATRDRLDRTDLGRLARVLDQKKMAYLDDLAEYAAGQPGDLCFQSIDQAYAQVYSPHNGDTGAGLANYYFATVLRFWGSLSDSQRAALRQGGSLRLKELSQQARFWLNEYVYGIPRVGATNFETPYSVSPWSTARHNIKSSPYEGLGEGIPEETTITGIPLSEVFLKTEIKDEEFDPETPRSLAITLANKGVPLEGTNSPLTSLAYARAPMVKIDFDFGKGFRAWTQVGDDITGWSVQASYSKLPDDIRKVIEAEYARAAAQKAADDAKAKSRTIPPVQRTAKYSSSLRH